MTKNMHVKRKDIRHNSAIRKIRFFVPLFAIYLAVLLLMSGLHTSLLMLMGRLKCGNFVQTVAIMVYWGMVALGITLFTIGRIKKTYEIPMRRLADATAKVAAGDFSVYVPTLHTADKMDYLDVMIMDFNKMVEELGSIETLKTDFVSNVSHEMKTPIAIIRNYAELLQAEQMPEEKRIEYAEAVREATGKLSGLISNILKLNKLESRRIMPEMENYDVCRQLCECILQFEDAWERKNITIETEMEDTATVKADKSLMELVWNNLLGNAVKFTEEGGSITVSQTSDGNYLRVAVADTGCGMSRESMRHIFDKFYQGDISHAKEGNGLGLALVKRVLELVDGDIQVASEEGKGSVFTVTLPLADGREAKGGA